MSSIVHTQYNGNSSEFHQCTPIITTFWFFFNQRKICMCHLLPNALVGARLKLVVNGAGRSHLFGVTQCPVAAAHIHAIFLIMATPLFSLAQL